MSSLSIEPNKGIRLQLANYTKTRSFQGGGEFWETQFQQIIRQCLGDFLPRAEQDQAGSVLFQHFVGSEEVCSKSEPIEGQVPAGELQRIERCIQVLKAKEADPQTDSNARKLIQAFRLPDPAKDPELYRVYGGRLNRKLLVLWGVEKESLSSLDPLTAVSRVRARSGSGGSWQWLWWLLALLLLLLIGWLLFQQMKPKPVSDPADTPAWVPNDTGSPGGHPRTGAPPASDGSAAPAPSSADSPDRVLPPPAPGTAPSASNPDNSKPGGERPLPSADNRPAALSDSPPPASTDQPKKPDSPAATDKTSPPPDAAAPPKSSSPPGNPPATPTGQPDAKTPPGDAPPPPPAGTPPASPDAAAGPQPKLEIINVSSDDTPHDGKVKIELKAVLHDASGQPAKLSKVTEWDIDGKAQLDAKGRKSVEPTLTAQLPKGAHRIEVLGTTSDGKPLRAAADLEVGIQSSVRFKSAE